MSTRLERIVVRLAIALVVAVSLAGCQGEEKKFGLTEAERRDVYLALLAERVVQDGQIEQELGAHLARAQQALHVATAYTMAGNLPVTRAQMRVAEDEEKLARSLGLAGSPTRTVGADTRARLLLARRTHVTVAELGEIADEGDAKHWRGLAR
jgi:hypothetical protein